MSIDDKSLGLGIAIGFALTIVSVVIAILAPQFIQKIRDSIADRRLGLIKENEKLVIENYELRTKIKELESNDDERKDN